MAIQNRRGSYSDFNPTKMVEGEFAVVKNGDPNTDDGTSVYISTATGTAKRVALYQDIVQEVQGATQEIAQIFENQIADDVQRAETAAETAEQAAESVSNIIDDTLTIEGKAADSKTVGDAITHLNEDLIALETTKADADGTYEDLTAGTAKQIETEQGITESVPYLLRPSGGDGAEREYDTVVGGTVAWNQLTQFDNIPTARNGITITSADNKSVTYNGTSSGYSSGGWYGLSEQTGLKGRVGHVVLLTTKVLSGSITDGILQFRIEGGSWITVGGNSILKVSLSSPSQQSRLSDSITNGATCENYTATFNVFDLTTMFGTTIADYIYSLEQSTAGAGIAKLRSWGFFAEDYYPYDSGSLKSVEGLVSHDMVGFNIFPEDWESGSYQNGSPVVNADWSRGKTMMRVMPGTAYYFNVNEVSSTNYFIVHYYDGNKAYIGNNGATSTKRAITIPDNCHYIQIQYKRTIATVVNYPVCISLSDPTRNGQYEPYERHSYPLDSDLTLRGIPKLDANNDLYYDGDRYESDGTVTRKYGIVDLGTLTWVKNNTNIMTVLFPETLRTSGVANIICTKYRTTTWSEMTSNDKTIAVYSNGYMYVHDSAYDDAAAFKAAMSGVYLVYELATETTESADPYTNPQSVDPYGTEEYVTTGIVPVGHETFYPENLRSKLEGLPRDFASLIAPTEATYKATKNYTTGSLFIVNNILYKATANIANGGTITPGTNCTATTLAAVIAALA